MLTAALASAATGKPPALPFESRAALASHGGIDDLAFDRWKRLGIQPANPCSDEVFLRRAYLDVIGTLPTPEEAAQFLSDQAPNKRAALIDRLLARSEFADYWAMKWSDLLRVKSEFPSTSGPTRCRPTTAGSTAIGNNLPTTASRASCLVSSGSNFRVPRSTSTAPSKARPANHRAKPSPHLHGARAGLDGMAVFFSRIGYKSTAE